MNTEKMREEFEAAYAAEQKEVYTAHGEDYFDSKECFLMHEDGFYLHDNTQSAWWGWKASRESIEVELPESASLHNSEVIKAVGRHSLKQGYRVKP